MGPSAGSRHQASWGPALTVPSEVRAPHGLGLWGLSGCGKGPGEADLRKSPQSLRS